MGNCAESTARKHGLTREDADGHAIESYKRAAKAWESGAYDAEIAPVTIKDKKGETVIKVDEEYKKVIFEKIPSLKPSFDKNGIVTAANASNLNDGGSAVILTTAAKAQELGLKPLAKIICASFCDLGCRELLLIAKLTFHSLRRCCYCPRGLPNCPHRCPSPGSREGWP